MASCALSTFVFDGIWTPFERLMRFKLRAGLEASVHDTSVF
jgi:hypothetical protein